MDVPYHGERHAVDLMFVFGLVLSEGTVPEREKEREKRGHINSNWRLLERKEGGEGVR